jgi:hypothetical protein
MNHYVTLALTNMKSSVHLHALYSPRTALRIFTPRRDHLMVCLLYAVQQIAYLQVETPRIRSMGGKDLAVTFSHNYFIGNWVNFCKAVFTNRWFTTPRKVARFWVLNKNKRNVSLASIFISIIVTINNVNSSNITVILYARRKSPTRKVCETLIWRVPTILCYISYCYFSELHPSFNSKMKQEC